MKEERKKHARRLKVRKKQGKIKKEKDTKIKEEKETKPERKEVK